MLRNNEPLELMRISAFVCVFMSLAGEAISASDDDCMSDSTLYLLEQKADANDLQAMIYLGERLLQPECSTERQKNDVRWLEHAADQGAPEAQFTLGMPVMAHAGPQDDMSLGRNYLEKAAKAKHVDAAAFLGAYLMSVSENAENRDQVFFWLEQAASDGSVNAALTAQQIYAHGSHGVVQDLCAAELWREAAFLVQHPDHVYIAQAPDACSQ